LKIPIIYFSASGNTKYIAQLIKNGLKFAKLEPELVPINSIKKKNYNLNEIEVFGIGAPVYVMAFTPNVIEWVQSLPIAIKKTRFFLFDTNAGMPGNAIKHIKGILEKKNYKYIGALEIVAPTRDSVFETNLYKYVSWSKKKIERSFQFGVKLSNIIKSGEGKLDWSNPTLFGTLIRAFFKIFEKPLYKQLNRQIGYNASKCTKCKSCEKICPTDAISFDDKPNFYNDKCMACFECLRICPSGALFLKLMPNAVYFKGPKTIKGYISPDELLEEYMNKV